MLRVKNNISNIDKCHQMIVANNVKYPVLTKFVGVSKFLNKNDFVDNTDGHLNFASYPIGFISHIE